MNIPAKVDYAIRGLLELAERGGAASGETLAEAQDISPKFLIAILSDLRRAGIVTSHRGPDGGFRLARPAAEITPADIMRALDGPLAEVRHCGAEATSYQGAARHLQEVWVAARASLRSVLEEVTLADIIAGDFPPAVSDLLAHPDAWQPELDSYRRRPRLVAAPANPASL